MPIPRSAVALSLIAAAAISAAAQERLARGLPANWQTAVIGPGVRFNYDNAEFREAFVSKILTLEPVLRTGQGTFDVSAVAGQMQRAVAAQTGLSPSRLAARRYAEHAVVDTLTAESPGQSPALAALERESGRDPRVAKAWAVLERAASDLDVDFEARLELAKRLAPLSRFLRTQEAYDDPEAAVPALAHAFDGAAVGARPIVVSADKFYGVHAAAGVPLAPWSPRPLSHPYRDVVAGPPLDWEETRAVLFEASRHFFTLGHDERLRRRVEEAVAGLSAAIRSDAAALERAGRDQALRADVDQLAAHLMQWRRPGLEALSEASIELARRLESAHPLSASLAIQGRRWDIVRSLYFDKTSSGIHTALQLALLGGWAAFVSAQGLSMAAVVALILILGLWSAHFEYVRQRGRRLKESDGTVDSWRLPHLDKHLAARRRLFESGSSLEEPKR